MVLLKQKLSSGKSMLSKLRSVNATDFSGDQGENESLETTHSNDRVLLDSIQCRSVR